MEATAKQVPTASLNGLTFYPVPEFDAMDVMFAGAPGRAFFNRDSLPEVPREYEKMASGFFYSGGKPPEFGPRVDRTKAMRALRAWLSSFDPPHECKIATVAYALWVWTTPEALVEPEPAKPAVRKTHHKTGRP